MDNQNKRYDRVDCTGEDQAILKVIKHQRETVDEAVSEVAAINARADEDIKSSKALLAKLGVSTDSISSVREIVSPQKPIIHLRSWEEIKQEAQEAYPEELSIVDVLSDSEIKGSERVVMALREKFDLAHRLDALDWGIAGLAGAIGALVDIFLVQVPSTPGRMGGEGVKGGWLSDAIRGKLKSIYSPDQIKELEKQFKVCYDPSTSRNLAEKVAGLGPRSHRFQSLGHDPILGFIFGVRDLMNGEFTAIDKFGKIITQKIPGAEQGVGFFEAVAKVFGHLKSDIGTPSCLPAPFMPLFQLLQFGDFDGRTIGQLSRTMYANGYDFGHFLAMSVPVMIIEVIVRLLYFAKRMCEGNSFMDSLPIDLPMRKRQPKLQTMLFTAHTIATAANAGKVWFTANPMAINLAQWQWYAKVSYSQLRWVLFTKPAERLAYVDDALNKDWQKINDDLKESWTFSES